MTNTTMSQKMRPREIEVITKEVYNSKWDIPIIGVDPGLRHTGIATVEYNQYYSGTNKVSMHRMVKTGKANTQRAIAEICDVFQKFCKEFPSGNTIVAIESVFFGRNVSGAMGTAKVIGAITHVAYQHRIAVVEINPKTVKAALGLGNKSDKKDVVARVEQLLGDKLKPHHVADAAAVAIACHLKLRDPRQREELLGK